MNEILQANEVKSVKSDSDVTIKLAVSQAEGNYDAVGFLEDMYQFFLQAVSRNSPHYPKGCVTEGQWKSLGSPKWNQRSTFDDFCRAAIGECEFRIDEIRDKRKQAQQGIPLILSLQSVSGSLLHTLDDFQSSDKALDKPLDPEISEIYEMLEYKNIETLKKFLRGEIALPNPKLTPEGIIEQMDIKGQKVVKEGESYIVTNETEDKKFGTFSSQTDAERSIQQKLNSADRLVDRLTKIKQKKS